MVEVPGNSGLPSNISPRMHPILHMSMPLVYLNKSNTVIDGESPAADNKTVNNPYSRRKSTVSFSGTVRRRKSNETVDILDPLEQFRTQLSQEDECRESFQSQSRRKHSAYSFTSDLPEGAKKITAFFERIGLAVWDHSDCLWAHFLSWTVIILMVWLMLYSIVENSVAPDGELFQLLVLIISAHLFGMVVGLVGIPPLWGMTIMGVVLKNVGFYYPAVGDYSDLTRVLKQLATNVGMVRAGMRLVPNAIYTALHCHNGLRLAGLSVLPSLLEAMVTAVIAVVWLDYPFVWAICLGFLLCPNSPAVITPPMAGLMAAGYGEEKAVGVLVHGAAGLDVAFSVSVFDICLSILFHKRGLWGGVEHPIHMVGMGTFDLFADLVGGAVFGLIAGLLPVRDNSSAVWKRTIVVLAGGMIAIVCGPKVGLPGTGPLSSICTGFVAQMMWKLQGPLSCKREVNDILQGSWVVLCPMLFAFSGSDVDISILGWTTICWMTGIVLVTVVVRMLVCFLVLIGGEFNWKEILFVGLIFQGKATNQAALAPQILYAAWNSQYPEDELRAAEVVTMGVITILICTPLAHLGAQLGGPYLLIKKEPAASTDNDNTENSTDTPSQPAPPTPTTHHRNS